MKQLQKRSKFEEIVNNKPIKIISKPDYTDVSNDFHISNIRDFDYDIEKQILDNKKELIQSDLLNEITTRMQRKDEKIKKLLDKTQKETPPNILTTHQMNSDNSPEGETEDIFTRENIDIAMKLAEEERKAARKEEEEEYTAKRESIYRIIGNMAKEKLKRKKEEEYKEIEPIINKKLEEKAEALKALKAKEAETEASQTLADKIVGDVKQQIKEERAKYLKVKKSPHFDKKQKKPTNKGKSQANDESMVKQMEVDAPTEKAEGMNIDTSGVKRVVDDTKEEILKRARQGEFIPNFKRVLNVATKAMIQQQMIMQGIPFDETHKKSVLKDNIRYSKWTDAVEENTIKQRLEEYKAEHGFLPLENVQDTASSSKQEEKRPAESSKNEPKAKSQAASSSSEPKAKSQAASSSSEPKAKSQAASSSGDPKPKAKLTLPKGELLEEEDEPDIRRYQQTPILSPKRASKNIGVLTENLKTASQRGLITGDDLVLYNTLGTAKEIQKIKNKVEKQRVMDNLTMLYKKYVYEPSLKSFNLSPKSGQTGVKKTIQKEK